MMCSLFQRTCVVRLLALGLWMCLAPGAAAEMDAPAAGRLQTEWFVPVAPLNGSDRVHLAAGMNLSAVTAWNREWPFVDVFRHARPWISQKPGTTTPWDDERTIQTTREGWPLLEPDQAAATLLFRDMQGHYPAGRYVCTFEGNGDVSIGMDGTVAKRTPGRIEFDVKPDNAGILLKVERSQREDPVRNIRVIMPGFEYDRSTFHPLFLERLKSFKVIRFMDWARTNDSEQARWEDRTTTASATQAGPGGVALEYMIELCNELDASPWFCMPHLADDDYVRQFATLVRDKLKPGRPVYVEWSNETWNGMFAQARWTAQEAKRRGLETPEVTADEARRDWAIWRDVFGTDQARVIRVAAGQAANPWVLSTMLSRLDGEFDAIAVAAYFDVMSADVKTFNDKTTADQVIEACLKSIDEELTPRMDAHGRMAREWTAKLGRSIPLVAYEGGQHLTTHGAEPVYMKAYHDAQTHPRMYEAYARMARVFEDAGGELLVAFNYAGGHSRFGCWGHLQYQSQPARQAPKFRAMLDIADGRMKR